MNKRLLLFVALSATQSSSCSQPLEAYKSFAIESAERLSTLTQGQQSKTASVVLALGKKLIAPIPTIKITGKDLGYSLLAYGGVLLTHKLSDALIPLCSRLVPASTTMHDYIIRTMGTARVNGEFKATNALEIFLNEGSLIGYEVRQKRFTITPLRIHLAQGLIAGSCTWTGLFLLLSCPNHNRTAATLFFTGVTLNAIVRTQLQKTLVEVGKTLNARAISHP